MRQLIDAYATIDDFYLDCLILAMFDGYAGRFKLDNFVIEIQWTSEEAKENSQIKNKDPEYINLDSIRFPLTIWREDYEGRWHKTFESIGHEGVFLETYGAIHLIIQSMIHSLYREG